MRKCACEAYGKSKSFSTKINEDYDIKQMTELFIKAQIFCSQNAHEMTLTFFWKLVTKPVGVGSKV